MRIYSTLKEAYNEIQRDLVEMGTEVHPETMQDKVIKDDPNFMTKELTGYCYAITSRTTLHKDFLDLGGNLNYVKAEVQDRTSDHWLNPGHSYLHRIDVWNEFLHNGRFSYTYNERIREQLPFIAEELMKNPNTRQAIITVYDRHQDMSHIGGKARIPCSMHYQFLIRRGSVDCIYTMRSCDIFTHFLYDVTMTMDLQEYISNIIGREPGRFIHMIGSLHAYRRDYDKKGIF